MSAQDSAYAALGLRSGAGRSQVDEAYRRLIKVHHPDAGGDSMRAAEINRAYSLLRSEGLAMGPHVPPMPIVGHAVRRRAAPRRGSWAFPLLILAVIGTFAAFEARRGLVGFARPADVRWQILEPASRRAVALPMLSFDEPLHSPVISSAIAEATKFHIAKDASAAEIYSRDCQERLRKDRNMAWFDACSAFDEATVTLSSDEELADSQAFNSAAVVARELAAARTLSDDILGADSRLRQIRMQVEMELLPKLDSAAAQPL
jgi:hypothetical protein